MLVSAKPSSLQTRKLDGSIPRSVHILSQPALMISVDEAKSACTACRAKAAAEEGLNLLSSVVPSGLSPRPRIAPSWYPGYSERPRFLFICAMAMTNPGLNQQLFIFDYGAVNRLDVPLE